MVMHKETGQFIGMVGELRVGVMARLKVPANTAAFELDIDSLASLLSAASSYQALSKFPSSDQDITLQVGNDVAYNQLTGVIEEVLSSHTELQADLEHIGVYRAQTDKRNISFRITLSHQTKTLTSAEVSAVVADVAELAKQRVDAVQI